MTFQNFIDITAKVWKKYLHDIYELDKELVNGGLLLYPNMALFVETDKYYLMELFGSNEVFNGLRVKRHKEQNIYKYLYQFPVKGIEPSFEIIANAAESGFYNLTLSGPQSLENFESRFNFIKYSNKQSATLQFNNANGSLLGFGDDFKNCFLSRCTMLNSLDNAYRAKDITSMEIVSKAYDLREYKTALENRLLRILYNINGLSTDQLIGIRYINKLESKAMMLSGQFANMFLIPEIRETTIGEFLKANPEIITKAFGCQNFEYEPEMEWIEGNEKYPEEKSINPDLMIEREDGFFDIVDLKTVMNKSKSITKGPHKRRRFIDYVNEGIAQLNNYKEYFKYERNRNHANSKYNIKVNDPKLYLVVGSYDNINKEEVKEACRSHQDDLVIIDYDTLNSFYLNSSISSNLS